MTLPLSPAATAVFDEYRRQLREHFGSRLVGLTLFGSYALAESLARDGLELLDEAA